MDPIDLQRVKVSQADACLVLANKRCTDPDTEDAANILRVISIKNFDPSVRVIIQLLQHHNKPYLLNIPCWDWRAGDEVVCLSELKMGFLAQSCLAPGFSTLLANLFSMRSSLNEADSKKYTKMIASNEWLVDYLKGVSQEIYSEYFSSSFIGMTFKEAAGICFEKLSLLLVALESEMETEEKFLAINPGSTVKIESWTQGFFICESQDDSKRAFYFCRACHWDATEISEIKKCKCHPNVKKDLNDETHYSSKSKIDGEKQTSSLAYGEGITSLPLIEYHNNAVMDGEDSESEPMMYSNDDEDCLFDITGMFHWVPARDFDSVIIRRYNYQAFHGLKDHVVACIFADKDSPLIGLLSFVLPLRASNLERDSLKHIIFIGSEDFLRREWMDICNFPDISLIAGSPMIRSYLRMARINTCSMCVVLSAKQNFTSLDDIYLIDKEVILCSLNIKSMPFEGRTVRYLSRTPSPTLGKKILHPLGPSARTSDFIIKNNPLNTPKLGDIRKPKSSFERTMSRVNNNSIFVLTELIVDGNVQFLDQNDEDLPEAEVYVTQPYACGSAFTTSVLDSLMSTAYFNKNAMSFIRTLITGGATPDLEEILAEGIGLKGSPITKEVERNRARCRIGQLSVSGVELGDVWNDKYKTSSALYRDLFNMALEKRGILCIALYRLKDHLGSSSSTGLRSVITNPPPNFSVYPSDLVFAIIPFESQ